MRCNEYSSVFHVELLIESPKKYLKKLLSDDIAKITTTKQRTCVNKIIISFKICALKTLSHHCCELKTSMYIATFLS